MNVDILKKKFSVGLCLGEDLSDLYSFFEKYSIWLNSIYFSVPLGRKFYSRAKLAEEYDGKEDKLICALQRIKELGIRRELTLNTRDLTKDDLDAAIRFCQERSIIPEEIVCLQEYAPYLRHNFPDCELKYSFNNHDIRMQRVTKEFDSIVIGKGLLRDMEAIKKLAESYRITYMLNNGCSFMCAGNCGARNCVSVFDKDISKNGVDYTYARSSIFPSELKEILEKYPEAHMFKFKISNRPWGLDFTQKALSAYISLEDPIEEMILDAATFKLFCATNPMDKYEKELQISKILEYKKDMVL